ncbi:hypothetical protein ACFE04_008760 [Oxalis oulophora]
MDSDQGKLFIGGISWETNEDRLKEYFGQYGDVSQTSVMRDKVTGKPRGFGFVVFSDPTILDRVLEDKHTIDGRAVEAKKALSKEEQQNSSRSGNGSAGRNSSGGGNFRTKKIFVGGLPPTLSEDGFRQYFEQFGQVTDVVIMYDQNTQRPRGFGFISFESEDAVDMVLHKTFHDLSGKQVEVKRALPKDANPGGGSRGNSSGYQGFGGNSSSYDNRMDSNRYMQSQNAAGGFPAYGSSGYFGPASNGMGYGGYGIYGGGPAAAAYGNPNVTNPGYSNGLPGARSQWGAQATSGYGAMGYGNTASWGGPGAGAGNGGPVSAASAQSTGGPAGYGNQGYGYGGYGGNEGSFGNSSGYGAVGGRSGSVPNNSTGELQGNGSYMGSGYGDSTANSGYGNAGWRSDGAAQGHYGNPQASGGYGGGYGAPARQAQQQ